MANWIYPHETLELMPTILLQELIVGTPLKNECHQKVDKYVKTERDILLCTVEKYRIDNEYKTVLEQFKRLTINPDGSKAKTNMVIRECKERKEQLYRQYKEEMNRLKFLEEQYKAEVIIAGEAQQRYWASMENAIETILWQRNNQRWIEIRRQQMMENQIILPSLKEEYEYLTPEELEEPMEDVCIICMDNHAIKDTVLTCCGHRFGGDCFKTWHNQRSRMNMCMNCPMCKNEKELSVTKYAKIEVVDLVC